MDYIVRYLFEIQQGLPKPLNRNHDYKKQVPKCKVDNDITYPSMVTADIYAIRMSIMNLLSISIIYIHVCLPHISVRQI